MKRRMYLLATLAAVVLVVPAVFVAVTMASPASGVTPSLLARGTYADFKLRSDPDSPVDIKTKTKSPIDVVVRRHDYLPGSTTGWHSHPGPVFITVGATVLGLVPLAIHGGPLWLGRVILIKAFEVIALQNMAVSREQEFHADLIAVSAAGAASVRSSHSISVSSRIISPAT